LEAIAFNLRPCLSLSPPRYIESNPSRMITSACSSLICAPPSDTAGIPAVHHDNASISPSTITTSLCPCAWSIPYTNVFTGVALLSEKNRLSLVLRYLTLTKRPSDEYHGIAVNPLCPSP